MSAPAAQRKSLRELRESTGTLFAKNNTNKRITCNTEQVSFELDPAGGPNAIMIVPKECLNVPGFQRLWMRGAVSISDDEAMENEIILQMGGQVAYKPKVYSTDKDGNQIEVEAQVTEDPHSRDMVFRDNSAHLDPRSAEANAATAHNYSIQADDGNGCVFCGKAVFIQQKFLDEGEPPLCGDHAHLKSQVASTPQPDGSWDHRAVTIEPVKKSDLPAGG